MQQLSLGTLCLVAASFGCGAAGQFGLSAEDNNPQKLASALARAGAPAEASPRNGLGRPLAFLAGRDDQSLLIAYDLEAQKELWRVPAEVESRVVVGKGFLLHLERGNRLVARDLNSGKGLWERDLGSLRYLGAAADGANAYYTVADRRGKGRWTITAVDGQKGRQRWEVESPAAIGAPAAWGGLVFSPFLKQWLTVLDGETGEQLTRIRGLERGRDEPITFVRSTSREVFFGSRDGVFLLDERAASGRQAESTFGAVALPQAFEQLRYYWDAFDPVQTGYSAHDRNRLLWRAGAAGEALGFTDDRMVVHIFRFFFGFDAGTGALAWAYNHPRVDVISSAHLGGAITFTTGTGDLGALDPVTGRRTYEAKVENVKHVLGATFDADGWRPGETGAGKEKTGGTAAALLSIARDRDQRFNDLKRFSVAELARLEGGSITGDLLDLIKDPKTPPFLREAAVEGMVNRRDPAGLPLLVEALDLRFDYIDGKKPVAVGAVARALAALGELDLPAKGRREAMEALEAHLGAPETPAGELVGLLQALGAVGGEKALPPLRSFLLTYRADPAFAAEMEPLTVAIDVLLETGGSAGREIVSFLAEGTGTLDGVSSYARKALSGAGREEGAPEGPSAAAQGGAKASGGPAN